jgi:hypothetical protein
MNHNNVTRRIYASHATVFIGSDPNQDWGMAFYKSGAEVEEEQSVTTSLDSSSGTPGVISVIVTGMTVLVFLLIV